MNEQERIDWLAARKTGLGSTDVAAIIAAKLPGVKSFRTPLDVWLSKQPDYEDDSDNEAMKWGRRLEAVIAEAYIDETGYDLFNPAFASLSDFKGIEIKDGIVRHPEKPYLMCSPDRIIIDDGARRGLEIKTVGKWADMSEWGNSGTDNIPLLYMIQVQWCLLITGFDSWDLAALIAGNDFRHYTIYPDKELHKLLEAEADKFWFEYVEPGKAPPAESIDDSKKYLEWLYPFSNGEMMRASDDDETLIFEYAKQSAIETAAKKEKESIKQKIIELIGGNDGLIVYVDGNPKNVTWKTGKPKRQTDWEGLARFLCASPVDIKKFTTTSQGSRRFSCGVRIKLED